MPVMKLSPGDQIQIILTVGGVPYAKTDVVGTDLDVSASLELLSVCQPTYQLMAELITDIKDYGDESVG